MGKFQPGMIGDLARQMSDVASGWRQVAGEMPAPQAINDEDEGVEHQQPGEGKMPLPRHGQPVGAGQGGPAWKAARRKLAVHLRGSQYAGGVDLVAADAGDAGGGLTRIVL